MFKNPLIQRYRASHFGTNSIIIYVCVYVAVVFLVTLGCIGSVDLNAAGALSKISNPIFFFLAGAQLLMLWVWGSYNSIQAIRMEYERKSYDFFRMLPLTANEKAMGIIVGRNLPVLLLVSINVVLMLLTSRNQVIHMQIQCVIWSGAAALNSITLLSSCSPHKNTATRKTNSAVAVIAGLIFIQWIVGMTFAISTAFRNGNPLSAMIPFATFKIPLFAAVTLVMLTVAAWSYKGILRKFTVEDMPLFTRKGAILFSANALVLFLMFIYQHIDADNYRNFLAAVVIAGMVLIILTLAGSLNLAIHYMETVRRSGDSTFKDIRHRLTRISNLWTATWLFGLLVAAIAFVTAPYMKDNLDEIWPILLGMFLMYVFAVFLLELYSLYGGNSRHASLLIGFCAILYFVLPLIISALLDMDSIAVLSGGNYMFANLVDSYASETGITINVIILNLALLCGMYALIRKQAGKLAALAATIN